MTTSLRLGAIDLHRPAIDVLIDKINALNTMNLVSSDFTLSAPIAEVGEDYDTKISLNPTAGSIWLNAKWAYYSRVSLESLMRIPTRVVTAGNALLYEILDAVNAAYGVYLQESDIEQAAITYVEPSDPDGPGTVTITARATSVFYKGEFTIPVNTQGRQGLNTYDDEAIYYVLVNTNGMDSLRAYNIRGEEVDTFEPFKGATFSVSNVYHFELLANGNLLLLGEFVYTTTNTFGEVTEFTRKLIKLSPTGEFVETAAGNVYGANYPDIRRVFNDASGAVFAIDPTNAIGGRPSLIHRYTPEGAYDNTFTLGLGAPASHFALHGGFIYVGRVADGIVTITKHTAATGVIDATFGPIVLTANQSLQMYSMAVDAEGVKLLIDIPEGLRLANAPVKNNGVDLWEPGPATAHWFPCLNFTLAGLPKPAVTYWRAGVTGEFTGWMHAVRPVSALSGGWFVFPTGSFHPYYGSQSLILLSASPTGEVVRSIGLDPIQEPRWTDIHSIEHVENGDIAICGEAECVNEELELVTGTALALYNRLGEISATLVTSYEPNVVFKKAVGRVP